MVFHHISELIYPSNLYRFASVSHNAQTLYACLSRSSIFGITVEQPLCVLRAHTLYFLPWILALYLYTVSPKQDRNSSNSSRPDYTEI
jgi:hypothetical protein